MKILKVLVFLALSTFALGQGSRHDNIAFSTTGATVPSPIITVCSETANPCTGDSTIYQDKGLSQTQTNPFTGDTSGNYFFYAVPGYYQVCVSATSFGSYCYQALLPPSNDSNTTFSGSNTYQKPISFAGLSGGVPPFTNIPAGAPVAQNFMADALSSNGFATPSGPLGISGAQDAYIANLNVAGKATFSGTGGINAQSRWLSFELLNNGSTGTADNKLVSVDTAGKAIITTAGATNGVVGVCVTNSEGGDTCGTTGTAEVSRLGSHNCVFDSSSAVTAGHFVQISASTDGACKDVGTSFPSSGQVIGIALTSGASSSTQTVLLTPDSIGSGTSGNFTPTNGILYAVGTSTPSVTATGGAGTLCLTSTNGGVPVFGACAGAAATAWSALTAPGGNLALGMGANTTTVTYGATANNAWSILDTTGNANTGYLFDVHTVGTSLLRPIQFHAQGTTAGVFMSSAGLFQAEGTGGIKATTTSLTINTTAPLGGGGAFTGDLTFTCTTCDNSASSLTNNQLVVGRGSHATAILPAGTAAQCLLSSGAGVDPVWGSCAAGTAGTVTNPNGVFTTGFALVAANNTVGAAASSSLRDASVMAGADICAKINTAYLSLPTTGGVIDARGFSDPQFCTSNPFAGANRSVQLLLGAYRIFTSVPWVTPTVSYLIKGLQGSGAANQNMTWLIACDATGTLGCGSSGNPTFPNATSTLSFTWDHGPFAAGTYGPMIWGGGNNPANDAFYGRVESMSVALNCPTAGNCNRFGYYTMNEQENSGLMDMGFHYLGNNSAWGFFDSSASASNATHMTVDRINSNAKTAAALTNAYGFVVEGQPMHLDIAQGTCTAKPKGYLNTTAGAISSGVVTYNGTGSCPNGTPSSLACTISAGVGSGATCTVTVAGGVVTAINITAGGSLYNNGTVKAGPFRMGAITVVGNGAGNEMTAGFWGEGMYDADIGPIHCEWMTDVCAIIGGGSAAVNGGVIHGIDGANTMTNGIVRIGKGVDLGQVFLGIDAQGPPNLIVDDVSGVTITRSNVGARSLELYSPQGIVLPGFITLGTNKDNSLARSAAAKVCVGNGTDGDCSGTIQATAHQWTGDKTASAAPRMTWTPAIFGRGEQSLNTTSGPWAVFTPEKAITVVRLQVQVQGVSANCSVSPKVRITNGSATQDINIANGTSTYDSGAITVNFAAATRIDLNTVAGTCTTAPTNPAVTVQYVMQ